MPWFALALLLAAFPERIRNAIDMALANPPEIAADALIQLAASAGSREGSIDLLERASALARSAVHPYRRGGALFATTTDSEVGRLPAALEPGLDGHSLQVRAARALVKLDTRRGTEAFLRISVPRFPPLTCKDALSWRSDDYYVLVREVFENGFSPLERRDGKHVAMLEDQVRALASPFQLDPLTRLLVEVRVTPVQFERLVAVYATALKSMNADDRSFTSGTRHGFGQAFHDLMERCRKLDLSITPLIDAFRTYLERGLTGRRCEDSAEPEGEGAVLTNMLKNFNGQLRKLDVAPIDLSKRKPHIVLERAANAQFWSSPATRKLFERMVGLTRESDKSGEDWEHRTREFLIDVSEWAKDHAESATSYFHQRAMIYGSLLRAIPAGALRQSVASEYVAFLAGSPSQRESPPEWYLYARDLRNLISPEEIRRSGHPGLLLPLELAVIASPTGAQSAAPKGRGSRQPAGIAR